MNKGLKYRYRQNEIKKALSNNKRAVLFPKLHSVRLIGVISSDTVSADVVKKIFGAGVNVHSLEFIGRRREKGEVSSSVFLNDHNFWGLPSWKCIEKFASVPFDLLINFSNGENDGVEYVCAKSVAHFKASNHSNGKIYDLVISGNIGYQNFLEEIKRTLINLNTET